MKKDPFALYEILLHGLDNSQPLTATLSGEQWCMAETAGGLGLAMHTPGSSIAPMFPAGLAGLPVCQAAQAVSSWNFQEASFGLAAANAWYNTPERLAVLGAALPDELHYTHGLDYTGMTVGIVGHMRGPAGLRDRAKAVYTLERSPKPGDYPDSACDYILPRCDMVIITGSSIINKTLPHLLALCQKAYVILTGPSVPMCPELLDLGIDRLAGLVVTDREAMAAHVKNSVPGNPYSMGWSFLLEKQRTGPSGQSGD